MKSVKFAASLILATAFANPSFAADASKADEAIKARQSYMTMLKLHFGPLKGMADGKIAFDKDKAAAYGEILAALIKSPASAGFYAEGTEKGDKLETAAKHEIWKDMPKYKELGGKFREETAKLAKAAIAGDEAGIKAQAGAVGKTCKTCHDDFRKDK